MERRAAETRSVAPSESVAADVVPAAPVERPASPARSRGASASRSGGPTRARAIARPIVLTREEEYRHIRADMNRLLITAGSLFVLMIVLLFVIEA